MAAILVQDAAAPRIDDSYSYTRNRWGPEQAERYIKGLFESFDGIERHAATSRPIPAAFGVRGFFFRYQSHVVYWRRLSSGDIGIVTVLHERMHQIDRLREDFGF
ncbi:MAG: type II toxin-antitoxin system RelE/ParE family toxin [Sphingomonadales bacterium]